MFGINESSAESPAIYEVQYIIENIQNVDLTEETYDMFFWIILTSDDVDFTKEPPTLQFPNGIILDIQQEKDLTFVTQNTYVTKVFGTFFLNSDFRNYPYSPIDTGIVFQIHGKSSEEVILEISSEYEDPENIHAPGLIFQNATSKITSQYFHDGITYSQFVSTERWQMPSTAIFFQEIFPLFVIGSIAIFILRLKLTVRGSKISATVGLVFALIAFHGIVIQDSLPKLTYLTFEEKLIIIDYALVVYLAIEILLQQRFNKDDDDEKAKIINNKIMMFLPVVVIITAVTIHFI